MASKDEAEWDQAHEVDTDTGRPTKELYTDNDPVTTIKGKIHALCFKSNTVKKRLVSHFEHFIVVA